MRTAPVLVLAAACASHGTPPPLPPVAETQLRPPSAFAAIADRDTRAAALFTEATRVMLHPRCADCHPDGDSPLQDRFALHDPPVTRGEDDRGVPGLSCTSCHQDHNLELARVPGAPEWHLAPRSMAWVGRTPAQLCAQVKDRARNGGKDLHALHEHMAHDALVGWGWNPGHGRQPAPGSQAGLAALIGAWIEAGAACPNEAGAR